MSKKEKIKILIALGISLILFGVFFLTSNTVSKNVVDPVNKIYEKNEKNEITKTILEVNDVKYESKIIGVISVYQFMEQLQKEGKIKFKDKSYSGMGKLIEEINGIKSKGNKYWIYYVNGKKANVGISNYKIKTGDVVSWKYQSF